MLIGFFVSSQIRIQSSKKNPTCNRCNVVVIVVDSLRADELPCYGYSLNTAPNLCRFADRNIKFSQMYANSNWTRPSNMSIFTSLYPTNHGIDNGYNVLLNPSVRTLPQTLYTAGYQTTLITNDQHNLAVEMGFGWGFQKIHLTSPTFDDATKHTWLTAIDDMKKANAENTPAFVFFHTDQVHDFDRAFLNPPIFPLDPTYRPTITFDTSFTQDTWKHSIDYLDVMIGTDWGASTIESERAWQRQLQQARSVSEAKLVFDRMPTFLRDDLLRNQAENYLSGEQEKKYIVFGRHLYDHSIQVADAFLAKVLEKIDQNKLAENTIVVVVSDHGQLLGEDGLIGHILGMNDKELHVPFIMRIPGYAPQHVTSLAQHIDIYPTLMELVGVSFSQPHSGISLVGALTHRTNAPTNAFVISQTLFPNHIESIQSDQWRLIESMTTSLSQQTLYDLKHDPKQTKNVANENPQTVQKLRQLLRQTIAQAPKYASQEPAFPLWYDYADRQRKIDSGFFFKPASGVTQ